MAAGQPQEVQFPFSIDLTQYVSQIERAQNLVVGLAQTAATGQRNLQTSFNETARSEAQVTAAITQTTQAITTQTGAITRQATATNQRRQAGVSLTQQLQRDSEITGRFGTFLQNTTTATNAATQSTNGLGQAYGLLAKAANILPGLGISGLFLGIATVIGAAAKAAGLFTTEIDHVAERVKLLNEVQAEANKSAAKQIVDLETLYKVATDVTQSTKDRAAAVNALQAEFPAYFKNISDETILNGGAQKQYDELTKSILATARATAAKAKLDELAAKQLDIEFQKQKIRNATDKELAQSNQLKGSNPNDLLNAISKTLGGKDGVQASKELQDLAQKTLNVTADNLTKEIVARRDAAIKVQDLQATNLKNQQDFLVKFAGGENEIAKVVEKGTEKQIQAEDNKAKALAEKRKREAEATRKLAEEESRNYQNLLAKLINDEAAFQAKSIPDNRASELAASDARFEQLKKDRKREIERAKVTEAQRKDLLKEFANFEKDATEANAAERVKINAKYDAQELKLREAALKAIAQLGEDAQQEEINKIRQSYVEQAAVINAGGQLTNDIRKKLADNEKRDVDNVNIKFGTDRIKKQTDLEVAGIKVAEKYQGESIKIERAKQLAILDAQIKGAQQQLELLELNGKDINSIEVRNAQEVINNLEQARKNLADKKKDFNLNETLFESIFGKFKPEEQEALKKAFAATANSIKSLTDSIVSQYDRQIAAKQKVIDKDNDLVKEAQDNLDAQLKLQADGYANDAIEAQKALDQKLQQRDADIASQDELIKKQQDIQKAQLIADTVGQASNLITASTQIFKAFSVIPFVGVPLAIAAIGLMLSSFIAAKSQAFSAIGDATKREKGGLVEGPSHAQGGVSVMITDRNGKSRKEEWEGGEYHYVVNKHSTRKGLPIIEALNDGSFFNMHPESLEHMLDKMGIALPKDQPQQMIMQVQQRDEAIRLSTGGGSSAIDKIAGDVGYLADRKRNEIEYFEKDGKKWQKQGNKIVQIGIVS